MMFADGWRFVVDGLDDSDYGGVVNNRLWLRIHEPDYQTLICETMWLNLRIRFCASIKQLGVDLNRCTKQFTPEDSETMSIILATHRAACMKLILSKTDT